MNKLALLVLSLAIASSAMAQSYVATKLEGQFANVITKGAVAGQAGNKAVAWSLDGKRTSLHPAFLASASGPGYSGVTGAHGDLFVGFGLSQAPGSSNQALVWNGTKSAPQVLGAPFALYGARALATDGNQIVGWAQPWDNDDGVPVPGMSRAVIWDARTGQLTAELTGAGGGMAWSVAGGQQVGYEFITDGTTACLWFGSRQSMISLHPQGMDTSAAIGTDGLHQVGNVGIYVRLRDEVHHGVRHLMNYAAIWSNSAESWNYLPFDAPGFAYSNSFAVAIKGNYACGTGIGKNSAGSTQLTHAVVWSLASQSFMDLHASLPAGYASSRALSVDAAGNVSGYAVTTDGVVCSMLWKNQSPIW